MAPSSPRRSAKARRDKNGRLFSLRTAFIVFVGLAVALAAQSGLLPAAASAVDSSDTAGSVGLGILTFLSVVIALDRLIGR